MVVDHGGHLTQSLQGELDQYHGSDVGLMGCSPSWQLGTDFDAPITNAGAVSGADASTLDWIDDRASGSVADGPTCLVVGTGIGRAIRPPRQCFGVGGIVRAVGEVVRVPVQDIVHADHVRGQGGGDVEVAVLDIRVVGRGRGHFKLAVPGDMSAQGHVRSRGALPKPAELDLAEPVPARGKDGVGVGVKLFVEDHAEVAGEHWDRLVPKVTAHGRRDDAEERDAIGEEVRDARVGVLVRDPGLVDGAGVVEEGGAHAGRLFGGGEGGVGGERAGGRGGECLAHAHVGRVAAGLCRGAAAIVGGVAGDIGDRDAGGVGGAGEGRRGGGAGRERIRAGGGGPRVGLGANEKGRAGHGETGAAGHI